MTEFISTCSMPLAIVFLIAGIFPLVPGAGIYYTSYYFIMNNMSEFSRYGMETIKVAGAIVLGIIFGFSLPQAWFNALQHRTKRQSIHAVCTASLSI